MSKKWLEESLWAFKGRWIWCVDGPWSDGFRTMLLSKWQGHTLVRLKGTKAILIISSHTIYHTVFPQRLLLQLCSSLISNSSCSHKWGRRKNFFMINASIILFNSIDWNMGIVMGMWPSIQSASIYQQKLISGCEIHSVEHNWPLWVAPSVWLISHNAFLWYKQCS